MRYSIGVWMVGLGLWGGVASAGDCLDLSGQYTRMKEDVKCEVTVSQAGCEKLDFKQVCEDGTTADAEEVADGVFRQQVDAYSIRKTVSARGLEIETVSPFLVGDKLMIYSGLTQHYLDGDGSMVIVTRGFTHEGTQYIKLTETLPRRSARR